MNIHDVTNTVKSQIVIRFDRCNEKKCKKNLHTIFQLWAYRWFMKWVCNSLWPSDAKWRHRSESTSVQVMTCCLTAPSHYLNQCWLIIRGTLWNSHGSNFTRNAHEFKPVTCFQRLHFQKYYWISQGPMMNKWALQPAHLCNPCHVPLPFSLTITILSLPFSAPVSPDHFLHVSLWWWQIIHWPLLLACSTVKAAPNSQPQHP